MDGGTGGRVPSSLKLMLFDIFWHFIRKKIARGAVYYDCALAKILARTCTWVMMICRHTHSLSLFYFLSPPLSLWRIRSPLFSLFFPLSSWFFWGLFYTHTHTIKPILNRRRGTERYVTKCGTLLVSLDSEPCFFSCFKKYEFMLTQTLSHSLKYIYQHTNVTWTPC